MFKICIAGTVLLVCLSSIVALPIVTPYEHNDAAVLRRSSDWFVSRSGIPGNEVFGSLFKRTNEKVNPHVDTTGHVDHGKTTLTAETTSPANSASHGNNLNAHEKERGITISGAPVHVQYKSSHPHDAHLDCTGHVDFCGTVEPTSQQS